MDPIEKIWNIIEKNNINIDAIFLPNIPDQNFYYVTNLDGPFEGCFALLRKDSLDVAVSELDYETAKKQGIKNPKLMQKRSDRLELIKNSTNSGKIGVVADKIPYVTGKKLESEGFELVDVSNVFSEVRMIKDKDEIKKLSTAVSVTKKAFDNIGPMPRNENVLSSKLEDFIKMSGCELAFPTICAADKNSALPHYVTGQSKINNMILVDFGAKFKGYCADLTRCIFKKKTPWFKETEDLVMKAYQKCVDIAENDGNGIEMQKAAQSILGKKFIHSIGHFLGRDVHEDSLSNFKGPFKPGMIFTIEPGLYDVKHGGIRFENDFLVTKNGIKEL